jgi:hypothetical protein
MERTVSTMHRSLRWSIAYRYERTGGPSGRLAEIDVGILGSPHSIRNTPATWAG